MLEYETFDNNDLNSNNKNNLTSSTNSIEIIGISILPNNLGKIMSSIPICKIANIIKWTVKKDHKFKIISIIAKNTIIFFRLLLDYHYIYHLFFSSNILVVLTIREN